MGKVVGKERSSKKTTSKDIVDVNEIKKLIEKAENGLTSRSKVFNDQNLKNYKKKLESIESGTVSGTNYPGEKNKNSTGADKGASLKADLLPNVLHKFASYTTLFTLSGVNERELHDHTFLQNPVHDVIARSSGIGADINQSGSGIRTAANPNLAEQTINENTSFANSVGVLKKGRDIFIEEVNMLSTVGPGEERGLADFVKMTFKLHEPYGISFIEKVRGAARINGYRDYQDAPMLLTIEFKGFDENGIAVKDEATVRKIPILITRVELDVNEGGAIYDVTAVRISDIAFDDRFKFPRREITIGANTLEKAGEQLAEQLNKQILVERDEHKVRTVLDEYRIEFDDTVLRLSEGYIGEKDVRNSIPPKGGRDFGPRPRNEKIEITLGEAKISSLTSITKLLEDMVRGTLGYEDLASDFWTAYLRRTGSIKSREDASEENIRKFLESNDFEQIISKNSFVDWFKIKTSVQTDYGQFDTINKMHRKIVTYKVIPYRIHVLKFMRPGIMLSKEVAKSAVKKQYNYLYTGANTDIQSLRINYKTAYYQRNTVEVQKKDAKGIFGIFEKIDNIFTKLIGAGDPDKADVATLRSAPSIVKGSSVFENATPDNAKKARAQEFYDYLTNPTVDMMRIEMDILGDPAYICQDQFIPLDKQGKAMESDGMYDTTSGSFNVDTHTPLMELNYRLPDDVNDRTGVMFEGKSTAPEENRFFAGVYQVVRIESKFSDGQFLQTLSCVRLNNQSGAGEPLFDIQQQAASKLTSALNDKTKKDNIATKKYDGPTGLEGSLFESNVNKIMGLDE